MDSKRKDGVTTVKKGDFVKVTLIDRVKKAPQVLIGTILHVKPSLPHISSDPPLQPGPVYELKLLTTSGEIWDSWIDMRDDVEIIQESEISPDKMVEK